MKMDLDEIKAILPHREPFLMLSSVLECEVGKRCRAEWHLTPDLPFFAGHFPGQPVTPGVLMIEALAQAGAIAILQMDEYKDKLAVLAKVDNMKFRGMVLPGQTLILETELTRVSKLGGKGHGVATLDGKIVCEGDIMFGFASEPSGKA